MSRSCLPTHARRQPRLQRKTTSPNIVPDFGQTRRLTPIRKSSRPVNRCKLDQRSEPGGVEGWWEFPDISGRSAPRLKNHRWCDGEKSRAGWRHVQQFAPIGWELPDVTQPIAARSGKLGIEVVNHGSAKRCPRRCISRCKARDLGLATTGPQTPPTGQV